jgi:hypothetical protein
MESDEPIPCVPVRHMSPPIAAALLSQPRALLSERQAPTVDVLKQQCPGFTQMRRLCRLNAKRANEQIVNIKSANHSGESSKARRDRWRIPWEKRSLVRSRDVETESRTIRSASPI